MTSLVQGPVRHIVLLTFSPETTGEMISAVAESLRGLPAQIPEILHYEVALDLGLTEGNAHLSVIGDFATYDDYETYAQDPEHQEIIATQIRPHMTGRTATQSPLPG